MASRKQDNGGRKHKGVIHDISGQRFGKLVAQRLIGKNARGLCLWLCVCDCGKTKRAASAELRRGRTKSCGCLRSEARKRHVADLIGKTFGRWTVVGRAPDGDRGRTRFYCDCACGLTKRKPVEGRYLTEGRSKSCGCLQAEIASNTGLLDLVGTRFGRLVVQSRALNTRHGRVQWRCLCDCGEVVDIRSHSLTSGETTSCGCLANELTSTRNTERLRRMEGVRRVWVYNGAKGRVLMRSSWEVVLARWLDGYSEPWHYEPKVFRLGKAVRYSPDFYLPDRDVWIEVKGRLTEYGKQKVDLFRKEHLLILAGSRFVLRIAKASNMQQVSNMVEKA